MSISRDTFEFDLEALERLFDQVDGPLSSLVDGLTFEVSVSPQFEAALLANKHRFVGRFISPRNSLPARARGAD
jgi:hypothetical protein